jgi:hypothetical protein
MFQLLVDKAGLDPPENTLATKSEKPERAITRHKLQHMGTRIIQVARFDKSAIQELRDDKTATGQALGVLLLVGLCYGLGYSIFNGIQGRNLSLDQTISETIANLIFTDFAVFVWSATIFLVGTKLFQGTTGYWQLARPFFFSTGPGILFILIAIPFRPIIIATAAIAAAWIVSAGFFVLKNVMGFNLQRALLTSVVGLLILAFIQMTI